MAAQSIYDNRRKQARVATDMRVTVYLGGGINRLWQRPFPGRALDFNRYGMAFVSPVRLSAGKPLKLDLRSRHMVLKQVQAVVVRSQRLNRQWRVGVRFYRRLAEFQEVRPGAPLPVLTGLEESLA